MERLPAGFRFDPTDDEVLIYLSCKVSGKPLPCHGCVTEGDIYDEKQLQQIFSQIKRGGGRPEYFFTQLKEKGKEGCKRFDRTVGNNGNWHATQTKKILDESGEKAAVPVPVHDLEPVTKAAKHEQFLTASTSYYLNNNSREEDAPLSCSILSPPIASGPSLTDCGTDMGKAVTNLVALYSLLKKLLVQAGSRAQ
ncbi:hypothetical protein RJ639_021770 [Escallonia herrerae]|uniref:NAC domain-containing protein n=1 Tax=Escallonia herrerae TaxID=1293975 RepID=A0AA88V3F3_9ASTE|nr:hypothetical protein RJ639_021770 [Escallonia herrerae]